MTTGFGRDISCTSSIRSGRFASGRRLVAEAIYRRLTTPRGMLRGGEAEANYGLDLTSLIGSVTSKADAASLGQRIESELSKDERIESVAATVVDTSEGPSRSFEVSVEVATAEGEFELTLGVDEVTVEILGLSVEG